MELDFNALEVIAEQALADALRLDYGVQACVLTIPQIIEPKIGNQPPFIPAFPVGTLHISVTVKANTPGLYFLILKNSNAFGWPLVSIDKRDTPYTRKIFTPFVAAGQYEIELRRAGCQSPNGATILPVTFGAG